MKLSDKIQQLRNTRHITQEQLAALCGVSRQAVTKWELGISDPDTDNIILLSEIFGVTTDVLLKETLVIDGVTESACSRNCVGQTDKPPLFSGLLIKESVESEDILDLLEIHKVELWRTDHRPKYWTALSFTSTCPDLPQRLSQVMIASSVPGESWFVDFKAENTKYIVLRDLVLHYTIGNRTEKAAVCQSLRSLGIPDSQMNWSE